MVKHIVSFKLKGSSDERLALARKFETALEQLPGQIGVLQSICTHAKKYHFEREAA